jgi:hypothetical protein
MRVAIAALVVVGLAGSAFADTPTGPPPAPPAATPPVTPAPSAKPNAAPPTTPAPTPQEVSQPPPQGLAPQAPPSMQCATGRRAWIPGWSERVTTQQTTPACFKECCVPTYETTVEAVTQKVCGPKIVHVEVPVWGVVPVPVWETRKVAICGNVTVPVYAERRVPVMGVGVGCGCQEVLVPSYWRTEQVQCGVREERRVLGYKTERVQIGTVNQKCQVGTRFEERVCGTEEKEVFVGTREVRRINGGMTQAVMVNPAVTRDVTQTIEHPGRWVTVGDTSSPPIKGTEAVMTEAEYWAEVRASNLGGRRP